MAFLEMHHQSLRNQPAKHRQASPESASVIIIQASSIKWIPVQEMVQHADMKNRRGKTAWWTETKGLVEAMVGRQELIDM